MRTRIIVAIIAAAVLVFGVVVWLNQQAEQAQVAEDRDERAAEIAREEAETEEEVEPVENDVPTEDEVPTVPDLSPPDDDDGAVIDEGDANAAETGNPDDAAGAIGEPDGAASGEGTATGTQTETQDTTGETQTETQDAGAATQTDAQHNVDAETLLTPEAFNRDAIIELIDAAEHLTEEERETLRELVEAADEEPAMVDNAIQSVRNALDLPPLQ
jgi:type II secretory pathway pseudopilin PulG